MRTHNYHSTRISLSALNLYAYGVQHIHETTATIIIFREEEPKNSPQFSFPCKRYNTDVLFTNHTHTSLGDNQPLPTFLTL